MSIDKWSRIDHGRTAHWWLGNEGTACGRDFRQDIQHAYGDDPRCRECEDYLAAHAQAAEEGRRLASERGDLIAAGADPADLLVPIHPEDA